MIAVALTKLDGTVPRPVSIAAVATAAYAAEIDYSDGSKETKLTNDPRLTWASSNNSFSTVIAGVKAGTAGITVDAGGKTSTALGVTATDES